MIKKFIKGKVYVFIDFENLFYSQKNLGWQISFEKLMDYFKKECGDNVKCFVYKGIDEHNSSQRKFLDMLDINGYILRTKVVKKIQTGSGSYKWKANLDIELSFEMSDLSDNYDTAILMSGDSDFSVVIDRIRKKDKNIIVMSTRGRISKELLERSKFVNLGKLKDIIAL